MSGCRRSEARSSCRSGACFPMLPSEALSSISARCASITIGTRGRHRWSLPWAWGGKAAARQWAIRASSARQSIRPGILRPRSGRSGRSCRVWCRRERRIPWAPARSIAAGRPISFTAPRCRSGSDAASVPAAFACTTRMWSTSFRWCPSARQWRWWIRRSRSPGSTMGSSMWRSLLPRSRQIRSKFPVTSSPSCPKTSWIGCWRRRERKPGASTGQPWRTPAGSAAAIPFASPSRADRPSLAALFSHDGRAADLREVVEHQGNGDDAVHQHEDDGVDSEPFEQHPEHDRQQKAAEPARQADDAGNGAHVVGELITDVLEGRSHAEGEDDTQHEEQHGEEPDRQRDAEADDPIQSSDRQLRLRIGKQEKADPGDPEDRPGYRMGTEAVGQPAAQGAKGATGKGKGCSEQRCLGDREAVLAREVLRHPGGKRREAAKDDRVVLAVLPDAWILQNRELLPDWGGRAGCSGIRCGKDPEEHGGTEQGDSIDSRHHLPAEVRDDEGRDEHVHRRADRAGTEKAHGEAALLAREEARNIGGADTEGCAENAKCEAEQEKLPKCRGRRGEPDRDGADHQKHHHDDATAEAIGPEAQRQPKEGAGEDGGGGQQSELGRIQPKLAPDGDAHHAEHHPDGEADGEGEGGNEEYGQVSVAGHRCSPAEVVLPWPRWLPGPLPARDGSRTRAV